MTVDTSPWAPDVVDLVASGAFGVLVEATLTVGTATIDLPITDGTLTYEAASSPRVQLDLDLAPLDPGSTWMLDPRLGGRLALTLGYEHPSTGLVDAHEVATLRLTESVRSSAGLGSTCSAASDETVVIGYPMDYVPAYTTASRVVQAVQEVVAAAFPGETPQWVIGDNVPTSATFTAAPAVTVGQDRWGLLTDWADSIGAVIYHDGDGFWHLDAATPVPGSSSSTRLLTGRTGTVVDVTETYSLDGYCNACAVVYTYTAAGVPKVTTAIATTGRTPVAMVTLVNAFAPVDPAAVVRSMLTRGIRRGHTVVCTAAAYLWVRPGQALSALLLDGSTALLTAETVSFALAAGSMTCTGQAPDQGVLAGLPSVTVTTTTQNP